MRNIIKTVRAQLSFMWNLEYEFSDKGPDGSYSVRFLDFIGKFILENKNMIM